MVKPQKQTMLFKEILPKQSTYTILSEMSTYTSGAKLTE
jgi:hypothetical protein